MSDRESLLERLTGGPASEGEDPRAAQFVRGLALGALVGAAIAGSTLWQRRRGRRAEPAIDAGRAADESPEDRPGP